MEGNCGAKLHGIKPKNYTSFQIVNNIGFLPFHDIYSTCVSIQSGFSGSVVFLEELSIKCFFYKIFIVFFLNYKGFFILKKKLNFVKNLIEKIYSF